MTLTLQLLKKCTKSLIHIKSKWKILGLTFLIQSIMVSNIFAQEKTITGIVTSASDGQPVPGAHVQVKDTDRGTITDIDGNFTLVVQPTDYLHIQFMGFLSEEILVGEQTHVIISLVENIEELDEVVVIGYGVQKKKLVTGATASMNSEEIEKRNSTNVLQSMQGLMPGINITSKSGQPGEKFRVVIRGVGTIGDYSPIYVVDGVVTGSIDYLNDADIESIDVLKDAASTAIYGSRAGNGVILITTKKGKAGKAAISFDAYYGVQNIANKAEMLNADQYVEIMNEQHFNAGYKNYLIDPSSIPAYTGDKTQNANTDWLDEMSKPNALTQSYSLRASGGSEDMTFATSLSYTSQEGVLGGSQYSSYERYTGMFNSQRSLYNDRLKIGQDLNFSYENKRGISVGDAYDNTVRGALNVSPLLPMFDDNGRFFNTADTNNVDQFGNKYFNDNEANPYALMTYNDTKRYNYQKMVSNVFAELEIIKNLKFKSTFGVEIYATEEREYIPEYQLSTLSLQTYSKVFQKMEHSYTLTSDNVLSYSTKIGLHKIDGMVGTSAYKYKGTWVQAENSDYQFNDFTHAFVNNANNASDIARKKPEGGNKDDDIIMSYFGRVQYNFNETYLFNASFRYDGSSKFFEKNRWGGFPAISAGWVISNEPFMTPFNSFLYFMKLRASWGQNGNSKVPAYQYISPIKFTQATYNFGDNQEVNINGSYPQRLPNENIKWERADQIDIGFDSRWMDNHIGLTFDWYKKTTKDWLIKAPVVATAGADPPVINGGNVINTGFELLLNYNGNIAKDFNLSASVNGAFNKNEVKAIPTRDGVIHGADFSTLFDGSTEFYRAEKDYPISYFWGWETDGVFDTNDEAINYIINGKRVQPDAVEGDLKYVDQDKDGDIDEDDKVMVGDPNPDLTYGFSVTVNYKSMVDLSIVANGVAGNQIVYSYRNHTNSFANYTTEILDRWTVDNRSSDIPRVTEDNINYLFSDIYVKDGDYLRISNITLGFDFSRLWKINFFEQFRLYFSIQNAFVFTKYPGMDPEVGYGFDNGDQDKFSNGIDLGFYPRPRTMLVGLNVKF